jgi:hypothetical protein
MNENIFLISRSRSDKKLTRKKTFTRGEKNLFIFISAKENSEAFRAGPDNVRPTGHMRPGKQLNVTVKLHYIFYGYLQCVSLI